MEASLAQTGRLQSLEPRAPEQTGETPGQSEFAPGQQNRTNSTSPGATRFAPGQQNNSNSQNGHMTNTTKK